MIPLLKRLLLSKQYHNVLHQIESGDFQGTELQLAFSRPENPRDCKYNPTPISKLKTDKLGLHDYIPSVIDDLKSTDKVKGKFTSRLLHYVPSVCNSSENKSNVVSYTPSSSKQLHLNENKYEPKSASNNQADEIIEKADYTPSSSAAHVKKNENFYEPINTNCETPGIYSDETLAYKPSLPNSSKNSNIYEPHGISSSSIEYQPSPEKLQKRSSPSILNEISNLSDEKQLSIKKPKLDISLDNLDAEFDIIDEILNGAEGKTTVSKSHENESSNKKTNERSKHSSKSKHYDKDDKSKSKSSSTTKSSSSSSKSSSHHHKSSHSHKSKSESSTKSKKK